MGRRERNRVATDGGESLGAENPFAGLSGEGLPAVEPAAADPVPAEKKAKKRRGVVRLRRLKAGKGGKVVTEISGFAGGAAEAMEMVKGLKTAMGTGGTAKGAVVELQGECRDRVKPLLERKGYEVKG